MGLPGRIWPTSSPILTTIDLSFYTSQRNTGTLWVPLRQPTSNAQDLVHAAVLGLRAIYRPGYNLVKAGVMLLDLKDGSIEEGELNLEPEPEPESRVNLFLKTRADTTTVDNLLSLPEFP